MIDRIKQSSVHVKTPLVCLIMGMVLIAIFFFVGAYIMRDEISIFRVQQTIEAANYCTADTDCQPVRGKCPLGCYFLVNKSEEKSISSLLRGYQSQCAQVCGSVAAFSCNNGICAWAE